MRIKEFIIIGLLLTNACFAWMLWGRIGSGVINDAPKFAPQSTIGQLSNSRVVETELLPLKLTADPVSTRVEMALGGGAVELLGDIALIMDRLGRFFIYSQQREIESSAFPPLPLYINEFAKAGRFPVSESTLRAHDMAYDETSGFLYVSHDSYSVTSGAPQFVISRIALSRQPVRPGSTWEDVYKSPPLPLTTYYAGRGAGGKMLISGRLLYFAIGDYSFDRIISSRGDIAAQNSGSPFGKIYSYDLDRKSLEVISVGHRVPQGLAATTAGHILETEHGPRGGDELNIIENGGNYGWPYITYGTRYFSYRPHLDSSNFKEKTIEPVFAWVPSIAATAVFESKRFDIRWRGNLVVGSLKAQSLFRLKFNQGRVIFAEPIWVGYRVRDMVEQDGRILLWTDDGSIVTVTPELKLLAADRLNEAAGYENPALASCTGCHSLERKNQFYWAPTLNEIYGAKIAGEAFQNYSEALKLKNGTWDDATLTAYLRDPQSFAPGTTMINPDLSPSQIAQVLNALKNLRRN